MYKHVAHQCAAVFKKVRGFKNPEVIPAMPPRVRSAFAYTAHICNPRPYSGHNYAFFRNRAELHDLCHALGESEEGDLEALEKIPVLVKALKPAPLADDFSRQDKMRVIFNDPERRWAFKVCGALGRYIDSGVSTDRTKAAAKEAIRAIVSQSGSAVLKSQANILTRESPENTRPAPECAA